MRFEPLRAADVPRRADRQSSVAEVIAGGIKSRKHESTKNQSRRSEIKQTRRTLPKYSSLLDQFGGRRFAVRLPHFSSLRAFVLS
jgi:hypothetical protein